MAYYNYKRVVHRADFQELLSWLNEEFDDDNPAGYDGHYWAVAADLLDEKDARIAYLESRLADLDIDFE
jgi:hypothetical protein